MNTKTLSDLLVRHDDIIKRQKECVAGILKNKEDRDKVMNEAAGPGDDKALSGLSLLATQETLLGREHALTDRQRKGSQSMLLNEALCLRENILEALEARRAKVLEKLNAVLAKFYPADKQRAKLLDAMNFGNDGVPQADVIQPIHKAITGMKSLHYTARDQAPETYAKAVLGKAEKALEVLAEK